MAFSFQMSEKLTLVCLYTLVLGSPLETNRTPPINIGYILFPTYQPLDVFGPLDILNVHSWDQKLNLYLIADTLKPVTPASQDASMNEPKSRFSWELLPTQNFTTAKDLDLDVLFVPGGMGTRANLNSTIDFVRNTYPSLKYLISVCTGAGILARAGVLDDRNATTNKFAWNSTVLHGPKTNWISHARWVQDGNVWTTSGVAAGMDGTLAWIEHVWSSEIATNIADRLEYGWHRDATWDPFADLNHVKDVPPLE